MLGISIYGGGHYSCHCVVVVVTHTRGLKTRGVPMKAESRIKNTESHGARAASVWRRCGDRSVAV